MNKQYILNHIDDLTAEQLTDYIKQRIVTLEELQKTECLDNSKRVAISRLLKEDEEKRQKVQVEQEKADDDQGRGSHRQGGNELPATDRAR